MYKLENYRLYLGNQEKRKSPTTFIVMLEANNYVIIIKVDHVKFKFMC